METVLAAIILAVPQLLIYLQGRKIHRLAVKTETLVNNQLDRQLERNEQLTAVLTDHDVVVPPKPPEPGATVPGVLP